MATINWTLEDDKNLDSVFQFVIEYELIPGERPCKTHNGVAHQIKRMFCKCVQITSETTIETPTGPLVDTLNQWVQREYGEQIENYILDKVGPPV